ncbi:amine oxidase [Caldovatus sediminis]|uniref:Tryptophan 2-monooxygenase n=1 Tax=Caldovatus sediminis TaxID=2041189 RepID=A0A8J2Z9B8_9PROT|nr:NAD(P)/FAD-dependent oxidoreductase [Caldovatus sediminis]GGG24857.1 amine oxidase [Caldovatus sediminis]
MVLPTAPEVAIVGAGAAGIAAARECAALGLSCLVVEAMGRVGGRAFTEDARLGAPFDHGASWLHLADANPLVPLARALGLRLVDSDAVRERRVVVGPRRATPEEVAALEAAMARFDATVAARAAAAADLPLAEAVPRGGFWDATVAHRQGPLISAAELGELSLRDFAANALGPPNLMPEAGVGALVRRLAQGLPIRTGVPVARIRWGGQGVVLDTPEGALAARACVVTVSTGVLGAGGIAFDPPLPQAVREAVAGLPLGLLTKVAFRAAGEDRLDLPPFAALWRRVDSPEEAAMSFHAWPFGRDHLVGFVGGRAAWELARAGPAATEAFAREELARCFGAARVARALRAPAAVVTDWGANPFVRGAYSYARPGCAGARAALAGAALAGGRLRFAGEACHTWLAGTVAGAWESGRAAARAVAAALG